MRTITEIKEKVLAMFSNESLKKIQESLKIETDRLIENTVGSILMGDSDEKSDWDIALYIEDFSVIGEQWTIVEDYGAEIEHITIYENYIGGKKINLMLMDTRTNLAIYRQMFWESELLGLSKDKRAMYFCYNRGKRLQGNDCLDGCQQGDSYLD